MDALFSEAAARLATHPKMGKAGKIAGTRELISHENYRLVYEVKQASPSCSRSPSRTLPST